MTDLEKAYIAGIIDGEGSIMLQRFHYNEYPSPCISIASTTYELLYWIKSVIGKGVIKQKKNYDNFKHKDCYSYILKYNDAIKLLKEIYPFLIINSKRKRAELILNKYKSLTPRNGRYSDELLKAKSDFYNEFISIK
ncbi:MULTISPECIES: LAGLIDADG family homing endonuclease [unclassified Clostridium]|uniref:LAGLIDADG family homing endonuclease n=1 Tax=unclassified Clostridium TaxID=2614128 RepID=UPI000297E701|nr:MULTISPECIES: LAGLIDADG family homing endonuclease [unclassified Clostridium]EKQ55459.1 MAG: hypothetical protein A370_02675 [Clostridium sp. Maddingley MBC34-26]